MSSEDRCWLNWSSRRRRRIWRGGSWITGPILRGLGINSVHLEYRQWTTDTKIIPRKIKNLKRGNNYHINFGVSFFSVKNLILLYVQNNLFLVILVCQIPASSWQGFGQCTLQTERTISVSQPQVNQYATVFEHVTAPSGKNTYRTLLELSNR